MSEDYDKFAAYATEEEIVEVLNEKDAEIERLKSLITELADALQKVRTSFDFIAPSTWEAYGVDEILQRAREATR